VILMVNKQPDVDTPTVTKAVEEVIRQLQPSLPKDVQIARTFRQANFIDAAIDNVRDSLRDGIIIVSIILFMFLFDELAYRCHYPQCHSTVFIDWLDANALGWFGHQHHDPGRIGRGDRLCGRRLDPRYGKLLSPTTN